MKLKIVKPILVILFLLTFNLVSSQSNDSISLKKISSELVQKLITKAQKVYELEGKQIPEFNLKLLKGGYLASESLKGKPTLINFWFSNCPTCLEEMPTLNEIKNKFGKQVNFISITFEDENEVNNLLSYQDFNFTHLIKSKDYIKKIGLVVYPITMILDKDLIVKRIPKKTKEEQVFKSNIVNILSELKNVR
jgi:thiol-disulfide isomerase/thioredoxin